MENGLGGAAPGPHTDSAVVELRQYTLLPGQRDVLIEIYERVFIEGQEATGIQVIDQFRNLDDPDRFVWLRGFPDMTRRAQALDAFYTGALWMANRDAANATMIDHTNVLLLRPARPASGLRSRSARPPVGASDGPACLVVATLYHLNPAIDEDFVTFFEREIAPELTAAGATIFASYVTEQSANTYPRLPVREGERVFVWFARYPDVTAFERQRALLARSPRWTDDIEAALASRIEGAPEVLRLVPTARSQMRA